MQRSHCIHPPEGTPAPASVSGCCTSPHPGWCGRAWAGGGRRPAPPCRTSKRVRRSRAKYTPPCRRRPAGLLRRGYGRASPRRAPGNRVRCRSSRCVPAPRAGGAVRVRGGRRVRGSGPRRAASSVAGAGRSGPLSDAAYAPGVPFPLCPLRAAGWRCPCTRAGSCGVVPLRFRAER